MYGQSSRICFCLCLLSVFVACESAKKFRFKVKDSDRITNGQNTTIDKFPAIVQIINKYHFGPHGFLCGGTLVSDRHVISAAHCFNEYNEDEVAIIANATYLVGDEGAIQRDVEVFYKHPKFDKDTFDNDIVVIKLSEPLNLVKGPRKAEMCTASWKGKKEIVVSGWGHTNAKATKHSNQLQTAKLRTLSDKNCRAKHEDITKSMSCSVVSEGKDACQGDSGGPAFYNGTLCGIVSFGYGCGRNGLLAAYASIPKQRQFIAQSMLK